MADERDLLAEEAFDAQFEMVTSRRALVWRIPESDLQFEVRGDVALLRRTIVHMLAAEAAGKRGW